VLLIDDVQNNVTCFQWNVLLKESKPENLIVLGVGIPYLSLQFDVKYPARNEIFPMFLTSNDMPEVCAYFHKTFLLPKEIITEVCEKILNFTSGHLYPFVLITNHVFVNIVDVDLSSIDEYLLSKAFKTSNVVIDIRSRCFDFLNLATGNMAKRVMLNKYNSGDEEKMQYMGLWNEGVFVSPLFASEVFYMMTIKPSEDVIYLDHTQQIPYAQQIICAGLRDMVESDFKYDRYSIALNEIAVGFKWNYNINSVLQDLWVAPQVCTKPGAQQLIDFYFDEKLNLGIALALNLTANGIKEHLKRFADDNDNNSDCKRYKNNRFVLHFVTENDNVVIDMEKPYNTLEAKNKVYTFVKNKNALYCGSSLVKSNVVRLLSPPIRPFCTLVVKTFLPRMLKQLR
jgi:hypothetical protein